MNEMDALELELRRLGDDLAVLRACAVELAVGLLPAV